ncbi:hypothetical protein ABPG74_021116 [Tetrahymena malaccensis]
MSYQQQRVPIDTEMDQYPRAPPPPASDKQAKSKGQPCCCWSLKVREEQVESFLGIPTPSKIYLAIFFVCFVFYVTYFGCIVSQSNTLNALYDRRYYFQTGQIIFGSDWDKSKSLNNLETCQTYSEDEYNKISSYLGKHTSVLIVTHFVVGFIGAFVCFLLTFPKFPKNEDSYSPKLLTLYLLCFIFYFNSEQKYKKYYITRLMEKFYSGNFLLLIFTSGTAIGFSPPIFIRTVSIGDGFSCISQGDANVMNNMSSFLYILSILLFCLYALSPIYLISNCIKIQVIKVISLIVLSIGGTICIGVSFIIIILYSTRLVKAFYLISFVSSLLQYIILYRKYINDKCNHPCFQEDGEDQA